MKRFILYNVQSTWLPEGFVAMFQICRFSLFFVIAELWGSIVLSLMFWGFANEITKVAESKRFYALFGIGANVALEFSGVHYLFCKKWRYSSCKC